jgi:hypothetical protein
MKLASGWPGNLVDSVLTSSAAPMLANVSKFGLRLRVALWLKQYRVSLSSCES